MLIFKQLNKAIKTHNILARNIYNWDEKGFIISFIKIIKYIINIKLLKSGQIKFTIQDNNREFIFLFTTIYVDGTYLLLSFIYKNNSNSL